MATALSQACIYLCPTQQNHDYQHALQNKSCIGTRSCSLCYVACVTLSAGVGELTAFDLFHQAGLQLNLLHPSSFSIIS